jgi:hypothetical protein
MMAFNKIEPVGVTLIVLSMIMYFLFLSVESASALNIDDLLGVFYYFISDSSTYLVLIFLVLLTFVQEKLIYHVLEYLNEKAQTKKEFIHEIHFEGAYGHLGEKDETQTVSDLHEEQFHGYAFS